MAKDCDWCDEENDEDDVEFCRECRIWLCRECRRAPHYVFIEPFYYNHCPKCSKEIEM